MNENGYIEYVHIKLKEILRNSNFIGKLEVEINIKNGAITNMNIAPREFVKI